jgi:DNA-binding MarR family transcriptional regulator
MISATLHRTTQIVDAAYMKALEPFSITERQLLVLQAIDTATIMAASPAYHPSQVDLVAATGMDRSTLADVIRRLVERKLIKRTRDKKDSRTNRVSLTAEGHRLTGDASQAVHNVDQAFLEGHKFGPLIKTMAKFIEHQRGDQ